MIRLATDHDWARMSWRQRGEYLAHLGETRHAMERAIRTQHAATHADTTRADAEYAKAEAEAILAALPIDPDAARHRHQLLEAITTRKDAA